MFAYCWIWPAPCFCLDNHLWQRRRGVDYANLLAMNSPWLRLTAWLIFVWGRGGDGMGRRQTPEVFSPWPRPPLIAHRFQTECQGNTIQESLVSNKKIKAETIWCKKVFCSLISFVKWVNMPGWLEAASKERISLKGRRLAWERLLQRLNITFCSLNTKPDKSRCKLYAWAMQGLLYSRSRILYSFANQYLCMKGYSNQLVDCDWKFNFSFVLQIIFSRDQYKACFYLVISVECGLGWVGHQHTVIFPSCPTKRGASQGVKVFHTLILV